MTGSKSRKEAFSDIPPAAKDSKTGGISESAFSESSDDFTVGAFSSESIDPISEKEMWGDVLLTLACVYAVSSGQEMPSSSPVSNGGFDMSPLHLSWNQVRVKKEYIQSIPKIDVQGFRPSAVHIPLTYFSWLAEYRAPE